MNYPPLNILNYHLFDLEMRYEYEKDKDITMLVCSLSLEYKYLNINKVIEVPTSIPGLSKG